MDAPHTARSIPEAARGNQNLLRGLAAWAPARSLLRYGNFGVVYALKLADAAVVACAGLAAHFLRFDGFGHAFSANYSYALLAAMALTVVVLSEIGVYRSWRTRSGAVLNGRLMIGWSLVLVMLAALSFLTKTGASFSRLWFGYLGIAGLCGLVGVRIVAVRTMNALKKRGVTVRRIVLVGPVEMCVQVRLQLAKTNATGFRVAGVCHVRNGESAATDPRPMSAQKHLGELLPAQVTVAAIEDLPEYLQLNGVDEVWLTWPLQEERKIRHTMEILQHSVPDIRWVPDLTGLSLLNHGFSEVAGLPVIDLCFSPMRGLNRRVKGLEDKVMAAILLLLASPVLLLVALLVRLTSAGPVFYKQPRVGWNGKVFEILKFRTMPIDVERDGVRWGNADRKPLTPIGGFLRRSNIDELPQLINVLLGDMSIVGPRPERPMFVEQFKEQIPGYMKKHMVKAGITGWAQVNGLRGDTDLALRIKYDLYYIEHWSLWFDLTIILRTALIVLFPFDIKLNRRKGNA